jgi:hypothetical protein
VSIGELEYTYQAVAYSTIPDAPENVAGVTTNLTFSLKHFPQSNRFELQIKKCSRSPVGAISSTKREGLCSQLKENVLPFDVIKGSVDLYPHHQEQQEVLNIKRGLVSALQVHPAGEDTITWVNEVDILGRCPTRINESHRDGHIRISKHRDTAKCTDGSNSIATGSKVCDLYHIYGYTQIQNHLE